MHKSENPKCLRDKERGISRMLFIKLISLKIEDLSQFDLSNIIFHFI